MYHLCVLYGHPDDPQAFDAYYQNTHIPIARRMQGLTRWTISKLAPGSDYYLIADLYAESKEAMDAILASPEGQAASADVPNFATGGATFLFGEETVILPEGAA